MSNHFSMLAVLAVAMLGLSAAPAKAQVIGGGSAFSQCAAKLPSENYVDASVTPNNVYMSAGLTFYILNYTSGPSDCGVGTGLQTYDPLAYAKNFCVLNHSVLYSLKFTGAPYMYTANIGVVPSYIQCGTQQSSCGSGPVAAASASPLTALAIGAPVSPSPVTGPVPSPVPSPVPTPVCPPKAIN